MTGPLPFSVVVKPTGAACNLDCQYCFFLSKELLYSARSQMMGEDTLEEYVRAHLRASPDGEVTMLWQGGEPALRGSSAPPWTPASATAAPPSACATACRPTGR